MGERIPATHITVLEKEALVARLVERGASVVTSTRVMWPRPSGAGWVAETITGEFARIT